MLLDKLETELTERLNLSNKIFPFIFFFDKKEEFRFLVDNLKQFTVLFFNKSFLELKYKIVQYKEEKPIVIYLPIDENEDILYLMDILVCSTKYHNTLYRFMENMGILFPKNKKKRNSIIKLLPSMIPEHFDKPLRFWNDEFGTPLIKDFTAKFKEILLDPERLIQFDDEKRNIFITEIKKNFGFENKYKTADWALEFIKFLCIVEMYKDTQDGNYPLLQKIPSSEIIINQCIETLNEIRNNIELKEDYKKVCFKIQRQYDLRSFIEKNLNKVTTLLQSEKIAINQINKNLQTCNDKSGFILVIKNYEEMITKKKNNFWVREGEILAWNYLSTILEFITLIEDFNSNTDFSLKLYLEKYCKIDQIYRTQKDFEWDEEGLQYVAPWIEKHYLEFLNKINVKFNQFFESQSIFKDYKIQMDYIDNLLKKNSTILMIDALRYELGKELYDKLEVEFKSIKIKPLLASRPPITNIGFSNLITGDLVYEINKKNLFVKKNSGNNLNTKQKRIDFLKEKYKKCECINLNKFLNIKTKSEIDELKENENLILFSSDIDKMGESRGEIWIKFFSQLLNDIIKAVRKLIRIGFTTIHILTDHGFLSFNDKDDDFKLKDLQEDYTIKKRRFLVSKESDIQNFIREQLECLEGYYIYYPRSIFYLKKDTFFHGGISIQELIIPHIEIQVKDKKIKKRPLLKIQEMGGIYNKLFQIFINSKILSTGLDPLVNSRKIKVWGEYKGDIITNSPIIDTNPGLNKIMLRIIKSNISKGNIISIIVQDEITEEILDKIKVEVKKEFIDDF